MSNKNTYSSEEFRKMMKQGVISTGKKGRLSMVNDEERPVYARRVPIANGMFDFDPGAYIFIPGHVKSSKNSKQIFMRPLGHGKRSKWKCNNKPVAPFITDSVTVKKYKQDTLVYYKTHRETFQKMVSRMMQPFFIELVFVMPTNLKWDFNNISQVVQDQMVATGWIADDDSRSMFTIPPIPPRISFYVNKANPGVYIKALF